MPLAGLKTSKMMGNPEWMASIQWPRHLPLSDLCLPRLLHFSGLDFFGHVRSFLSVHDLFYLLSAAVVLSGSLAK